MHKITLKIINNVWVSIHTDPEVMDLFDTDVLPTPFKGSVSSDIVLDRIRKLNPGSLVTL